MEIPEPKQVDAIETDSVKETPEEEKGKIEAEDVDSEKGEIEPVEIRAQVDKTERGEVEASEVEKGQAVEGLKMLIMAGCRGSEG